MYSQDSLDYIRLARSLTETFTFGHNGVAEIFRVPGYPVLLALASLTGHLTATTVLIQVALGVATVALVYAVAAGSGDERLALVAGWIAVFEPSLVMYCGRILSETLFTALLATSLFVWLRRDISPGSRAAAVGVLASAAALVRPVGYFVPLVYAVSALVTRRAEPWAARLRSAVIIVAVSAGMLGLWHARNARVAGFWGFSGQADRQAYLTSDAWLTAEAEGRSFAEVRSDFTESIRRATGDADDRGVRFTREARRRGLRFLQSHLFPVLRLQLTGSLLVLLEPPRDNIVVFGADERFTELRGSVLHSPLQALTSLIAQRRSAIVWLMVLGAYWLSFLILAGVGIIRLWAMPALRQYLGLAPALMAGYLLFASGGYFGQARFRHPLMPILSIIAAAGVLWVRDRVSSWWGAAPA